MAQKVKFQIETPKGRNISIQTKNGQFNACLQWNSGFGIKKSNGFSKAQVFVDSECLDSMNPLTPRLTGAMIKSGILGTVPGSGKIEYVSPYARRQYYENNGKGERGRLWFERMKAQNGERIRKGAEVIAAGK